MDLTYEIPEAIKTGVQVPELNGYNCIEPNDPVIDIEYYSGGFCQTYPLEKKGAPKRCLRLWMDDTKIGDIEHVKRVASFFSNGAVEYVIPYRYYEKALRLNNGIVIPGVVMDWVEGDNFIDYIRKHYKESKLIRSLAEKFYKMVRYLNSKGMSHGDLSGDNIIVRTDGSLCLIDYDSFFVPGFENVKQSTKGTGGYQPFARKQSVYLTRTMDYFSQQVIYLSLLAIADNPDLICLLGEKELLFSEKDFKDTDSFIHSKGCTEILKKTNNTSFHGFDWDPATRIVFGKKETKINFPSAAPEVLFRLDELRKSITQPLSEIQSVCHYPEDIKLGLGDISKIIVALKTGKTEELHEINELLPIKHNITIRQSQYGQLFVTPTKAAPGEIVTFQCAINSPNEYRTKEFKVTIQSNNEVWRLGNQRSFKMPDSDVTIEAEFEKITSIENPHIFRELNYCPKCGTPFHSSVSSFCIKCGRKRE